MQPSSTNETLEELEICKRHQRHQRLSSKFYKNTYVCVNRYCANSFELACSKCKNELHKDHSIKFISLESFRNLLMLLTDQQRRLPTDAYEMHKKHRLIKQFRRKMQLIESDLNLSVGRLIMWSETAENEQNFNFEELSEFSHDFQRLLKSSPNEFTERCRSIGRFVDYNTKKDVMEFNSTRLKECESERRRQLEQVRKQLEEIKEYSMKIIEVVLHHTESDEQDEIQMLKKRIQTMRQQNLLSDKEQLKAYKDGVAELVNDINSKNEELGRWIRKIEENNLGLEFDYGTSNYAKDVLATAKVEQLERNLEQTTQQLSQKSAEIEDLKKKISRMAQRINEKKRASVTEEESANQSKLKHEVENLQGRLATKEANELELEQRLTANEKELHRLTVENSMMELQLKELEQTHNKSVNDNEKLRKDCEKLKSTVNELEKSVSSFKAQSAKLGKQLQIERDKFQKQTAKTTDLQQQYTSLAGRLNGLLSRSQVNSESWKQVNDSKTETIHRLTEKCRDLISETKKRVLNI